MANLEFRYGSGKSADICMTAYAYNSTGSEVIVLNGDNNKEIISKDMNGDTLLSRNINMEIFPNSSLFDQIHLESLKRKISCVLVDNSHFLSVEQAEDLFFVANLLNIKVLTYGNRMLSEGIHSVGAIRLMELSNVIKEIDTEADKIGKTNGAKLEFCHGTMNSSKTANLLYKRLGLVGKGYKVGLWKPSQDRDAEMIMSRVGLSALANVVFDGNTNLYDYGKFCSNHGVNYLLIDEAQFGTESQIDQLRKIVDDYGISIRCYGLKVDFLSHCFPGSMRLLEISDSLIQMDTKCNCCDDVAIFNARTINGIYQTSGEVISIDDGSVCEYVSLAPNCYIDNVMATNPRVLKMLKMVGKR